MSAQKYADALHTQNKATDCRSNANPCRNEMSTPRTNEALLVILERDGELSEDNAPAALVKLCKWLETDKHALVDLMSEARDILPNCDATRQWLLSARHFL